MKFSTPKMFGDWLVTAAWFGLVTGLLEGCGLLVFQTLNRDNWALHVSPPIIGISTFVDLVLTCFLAVVVVGIVRLAPRISASRVTAVLLIALATYDLLTLTERISSRGRILLTLGVAFAFRRWLVKHEAAAQRFWRRTLPWVAAVGLLVGVGIPVSGRLREYRELSRLPAASPNSPNVLVIVVDTLRADHLSAYGYSRPTSPNIDRLSREGVTFDNTVSTCSWTYPSHVSLVTGRYLFEHRTVRTERIPLFFPDKSSFGGYPTIGEAMEERGYRTGGFSGNRFFFIANDGFGRGFIHFEDYYNSLGDMVARTLPGKEFLRLYGKIFRGHLSNEWLEYGTNYGIRKRADDVNRELLGWIDRGGPHPFFAFLNYLDVHDPYGVPAGYPKLADGSSDVDRYDNGVHYTDAAIGELLSGLKQRGLDKNTLVIVTSDHGESLGEHGFTGHGRLLYWDLIHVPLIIWYPGHVPAGARIAQPVSNVTLPATILALLGGDPAKRFRGPSLDPLWTNPGSAGGWPDPISELAENQKVFKEDKALEGRVATAKDGPLKSLISANWHLIIHKKFGEQLYDWVRDPDETQNLIASPAGEEVARQLISEMSDDFRGPSSRDFQARATLLSNGTFMRTAVQAHQERSARLDDFYRIQAQPGSKVTIEVKASDVDSVMSVQDTSGRLFASCRNPGDDHLPRPGIADATPDAFDDLCMNDDLVPSVDTNSKLEILVPGQAGPSVDLYVRVWDWNEKVLTDPNYKITVSGGE